jgi:protein-tyrosine-phosphatase
VEDADIVINMTGRPGILRLHEPGKIEDWDVEDPYGSDSETYQRVFEDIERRVTLLVDRMRASRAGECAGSAKDGGTGSGSLC